MKLNALPAYDDRYIKNKIRTCGDKAFTNSRGLNIAEDDIVIQNANLLRSFLLILYL